MTIKKLIIYNDTRFNASLSEEKIIEFTPKKNVVLLLGQNGSGKSSLIKEMSPFPADLKLLGEGGYKEIHIEHNGNNYTCTSHKIGKRRHQFIMNGEELNQSNLQTIQLKLIEEHFKLTPQLYDVMIDKARLTDMSVGERKKWLIDISNIDFTFALRLFAKFNDRARDIKGTIKHLENVIANEKSNLLTDDLIVKLKKDQDFFENIIKQLLITKHNEIGSTSLNVDSLNTKSKELENLFSKYKKDKPGENVNDKLIETKTNLVNKNQSLNEHLNKYTILNKSLNTIDSKEYDILKQREKLLKNSLIEFETLMGKEFKLNILTPENINSFKKEVEDISTELSGINQYFTKESSCQLEHEYKNITDKINNAKIEISTTESFIQEQKEFLKSDETQCPKCDHRWKQNYDDLRYKSALTDHKRLVSLETSLNTKLCTIKDKLSFLERFRTSQNVIDNIINNSSQRDYWISVLRTYPLTENSGLFQNIEQNIKAHLPSLNSIYNNIEELKNIESDISKADLTNNINKQNIKIELDACQKTISDLQIDVRNLENNIKYIKTQIVVRDNLKSKQQDVINELKSLSNEYRNIKKSTYNEHVDLYIQHIEAELSKIKHKINSNDKILHTVLNDEKQLTELKSTYKVLMDTITALSPNKGLISESLGIFLETLILNVNKLIAKVWKYPMEVNMVKFDNANNELDYKFPVRIHNDGQKEIEDVSKTSTGMKEMINLAFKIVSIKMLGINNMCLYFDEPGSSMDYEHRLSLFNVLDYLSTDEAFSQLFIISHDDVLYSRLKQPDVGILNEENLRTEMKETGILIKK